MAAPWSWSATVKAPQPAQLSLNLSTSASTPPSLDALLDSTTPALDIQVTAGGVLLDPQHLVASALVAEVRDWLDRNKPSIAVDQVGPAMATDEGVSIALHAFSRSAQAATLSLASATATADASAAAAPGTPPRLVSLALSLAFRSSPTSSSSPSASRPRKRARRSPSPATPPLSQAGLGPGLGGIMLAAQLLDPRGAPLHFALAGLVEGAMERWAKKLVGAFPLCFNARWIERVSGDLAAQRSVAGSLRRILALGAGGEPQSRETGEVEDEVEDQSVLLMSRLSEHLSSTYAARFPPAPSPAAAAAAPPSLSHIDPALLSPPPSPPLEPVEPTVEPAAALEAALLLLATRAAKPDPWVAPQPPDEREVGAAKAGKSAKGGTRTGQGGGARGARRGRARRTSLGDDDDDLLLDDDPPARPDSPPLDFDARPTSTSTSPRARALAGANEAGGEASDDDEEMDWQLADEL
ncbi:hypothetical protein JCM9279_000248 [Rhodotorula babjevae]